MGTLTFRKQSASQVTPPSGTDQLRLFLDLDNVLKAKSSAGDVFPQGPGTAISLAVAGGTVNVSGSPMPVVGQVLMATGPGAAVWTSIATGPATQLDTTGAPVTVGSAAPPVAGHVLTATSATNAIWKASGGALKPTAVQTNNYDAAIGDLVLCNLSDGTVEVTLPATHAAGEQVGVKMVSTAGGEAVEIYADSATETIDGEESLTLNTDYEWAILVSDGANWLQIG